MTTMASPHAPRPTRVASYALHFQIPILPMPTPPSLLKRQSSSSSDSSSTAPYSSSSDSVVSSARSTPVTVTSPRIVATPMTPASPRVLTRTASISIPRRVVGSAPSSLCASPTIPNTPYSTPLDSFDDLSYPVFRNVRPPILRRDTPRPRANSMEVDQFEAQFEKGLGFDMSS